MENNTKKKSTLKTVAIAVLVIVLGLVGVKACSDKDEPVIVPETTTEVEEDVTVIEEDVETDSEVEAEEPLIPEEEIEDAEAEVEDQEASGEYGPDLEEKI